MINTECPVSTKGMRIWKARETMNRNDKSMEWFRNLHFDTHYIAIHLKVAENSNDASFYVFSDRCYFVDYVTINVVLKIEEQKLFIIKFHYKTFVKSDETEADILNRERKKKRILNRESDAFTIPLIAKVLFSKVIKLHTFQFLCQYVVASLHRRKSYCNIAFQRFCKHNFLSFIKPSST